MHTDLLHVQLLGYVQEGGGSQPVEFLKQLVKVVQSSIKQLVGDLPCTSMNPCKLDLI